MTECPLDTSSRSLCGTEARAAKRRSLCLWAVLAVALGISFAIDGPVMAAVEPLHHSPFADFLSNTVRWLGNGKFQVPAILLLIVAGAMFSRQLLRASGWALLTFLIAGAAANIIKVLVHRARPWVTTPPPEAWSDYLRMSEFQSFPSGDSTTIFALAVIFGAWFAKLRVPLLVTAVAVAVSRILVGSHYPSDIAAGALLGIVVGQFVRYVAQRRCSQACASTL